MQGPRPMQQQVMMARPQIQRMVSAPVGAAPMGAAPMGAAPMGMPPAQVQRQPMGLLPAQPAQPPVPAHGLQGHALNAGSWTPSGGLQRWPSHMDKENVMMQPQIPPPVAAKVPLALQQRRSLQPGSQVQAELAARAAAMAQAGGTTVWSGAAELPGAHFPPRPAKLPMEAKLSYDALAASERSTAASLGGRGSSEGSEGGASASVAAVSRRVSSATDTSGGTLGAVVELVVSAESLAQTRRQPEARERPESNAITREGSLAGFESVSQDTIQPGLAEERAEGREKVRERHRSSSRRGRAPTAVAAPAGRPDSAARSRSDSQSAREERRQRREEERRQRHEVAKAAHEEAKAAEGAEVVWAGANAERSTGGAKLDLEVATCFEGVICEEKREADALGQHFSTRSPPAPRCRSPEKLAHSRSPSHQVEEDWRVSLCEERGPGRGADFQVPRLRPSRSVSWGRRRSESPARREAPGQRGASCEAPARARPLSVAMFGPVESWPSGSPTSALKATEHVDATGRRSICLMERSPSRPRAAAEPRIRRQYMKEVVDATGHISFCVTGRRELQQSPPRPSSSRPHNVARHTVDARGVRRHMLVEATPQRPPSIPPLPQ